MRSFLERALRSRCGLVESVGSVEEAMGFQARVHFDLIILDIALPGKSGIERGEIDQADADAAEAHGETRTESERSILPQFIRPLTEAQKQAAVQARLSALKYAEAKNVSDTHGGDHATPAPAHAERAPAPAKAEHHDPEPAPVRKAESHPAPVRAAAPTPKPAPKPKVVLARAAPSDTHAARATMVSSKRAPAKPAAPLTPI